MEVRRSFRFRRRHASSDLDPPILPAGRWRRRRHGSSVSLPTSPRCAVCGARMYRAIKLNSTRERTIRAAAGLAPVLLLSYRIRCSGCPAEIAVKLIKGDQPRARSPDGGREVEPGAPCDDVAASLAGLHLGGTDGSGDADMMIP